MHFPEQHVCLYKFPPPGIANTRKILPQAISIAEPTRNNPLKGKKLNGVYDANGEWQGIVAFECKGADLIKFHPTRGYMAATAKGAEFEEVGL